MWTWCFVQVVNSQARDLVQQHEYLLGKREVMSLSPCSKQNKKKAVNFEDKDDNKTLSMIIHSKLDSGTQTVSLEGFSGDCYWGSVWRFCTMCKTLCFGPFPKEGGFQRYLGPPQIKNHGSNLTPLIQPGNTLCNMSNFLMAKGLCLTPVLNDTALKVSPFSPEIKSVSV